MSAALIRSSCLLLGCLALAAHAGEPAKPAKQYKLTPITATNNAPCEPGFTQNTFTRRMSESGQIIGYHECWEATGDPTRPFLINAGWGYLWTPGAGSVLLPNITAGAQGTFGRAVNLFGIAVGWEFNATSLQAPIWFPSGAADYVVASLCTTGFPVSQADDINDHNSVAASSNRTSCGVRNWILRLANGTEFIGPSGRPNALNNHDVLVGQQLNDAVKWSPTTFGTVVLQPGTPFDRAQAWNLNDREEVVGEFVHNDSNDQCVSTRDAMYWSPTGAARTLERLRHDTHGTALAINEHGLVVGYSESFTGCGGFEPDLRRAVIWHKGHVTDLNKLLKKADARAIQLITASDITNRGEIAAYGFYRNQALTKCPNIALDPDTGEESYDDTLMCRSIYAFMLTPN